MVQGRLLQPLVNPSPLLFVTMMTISTLFTKMCLRLLLSVSTLVGMLPHPPHQATIVASCLVNMVAHPVLATGVDLLNEPGL